MFLLLFGINKQIYFLVAFINNHNQIFKNGEYEDTYPTVDLLHRLVDALLDFPDKKIQIFWLHIIYKGL